MASAGEVGPLLSSTMSTTLTFDPSIEGSVQFQMVDDLLAVKKVTEAEATELKVRFSRLMEASQLMQEREKALLKRSRALTNDVLKERIALQEGKVQQADAAARVEQLEKERESLQRVFQEVEAKDSILKFQLAEAQALNEELEGQMQDMKLANENLVQPELQQLRDSIGNLEKETTKVEEDMVKDTARKKKLVKLTEDLRDEIKTVLETQDHLQEMYKSVEAEPTRVSKQIDIVTKAQKNMTDELNKMKEKILRTQQECDLHTKRNAEGEEAKKSLLQKMDLHRETMQSRHADLASIKKQLDLERDRSHQLTTRKLELDINKREVDEGMRHLNEGLGMSKKEYDILKRKIKTKQCIADAALELLPQLEQSLVHHQHVFKTLSDECKRNAEELEQERQEVDMHIARFLKQETLEKDTADEFQGVVDHLEKMEMELAMWVAEDRKQTRMVGILQAHREIKVREASRAKRNEREAAEQLRSKELVILELTKKCTDLNNRLKEFSALYDIVKNERNKYVNQIQVSNQALAEMKEKIKILQNEIEILRNECKVKDRELAKEIGAHQAAQVQRDALRYDTNKSQAEYKKKQEVVDQQIVEIDKLNSLINQLERKMLSLKTSYERAVESRNLAGVQLIDRNDELCILYEKANIQEQTLKTGEMGLLKRHEELRLLKLQVAEVSRQVEAAKKQVPQVREYAAKISKLQEELAMEKTLTDRLCKDLEDPRNVDRWKALPGITPDAEQLLTKIEVLQERLDRKKEVLLEKDLMLEEVSNLTIKLRNQALLRRQETLDLAKRASEFQGKIRDTTRKMMALVAELSMYQATALKLQQEKHIRQGQLEMAGALVVRGEAPSLEAEKEWARMKRAQKEEEAQRAARAKSDASLQLAHPLHVPWTTAEPRPNAYLEPQLGVPKPYGMFAPLKPAEAGSTMRHIRPPILVEIEI